MQSRPVRSSTQAPAAAVSTADACRPAAPGTPTRVVRLGEVMARTGLSRTTLWRLERRGAFPPRRQLSPGTVGWIEAEVEAWILGRLTRAAGEPCFDYREQG